MNKKKESNKKRSQSDELLKKAILNRHMIERSDHLLTITNESQKSEHNLQN
jgi:hypothetical protein